MPKTKKRSKNQLTGENHEKNPQKHRIMTEKNAKNDVIKATFEKKENSNRANDSDDGDFGGYVEEMADDYYCNVNKEEKEKELENRVCKFYATKAGCWNGKYCTREHTSGDATTITEKVQRRLVYFANEEDRQTDDLVGKWVVVMVTSMLHPGNFHVVFPFGVENDMDDIQSEQSPLQEFMNDLNEYYFLKCVKEMGQVSKRVHYGLGEVVVVWSRRFQAWLRAQVMSLAGQGELLEVYYIDYGDTEVVSVGRLRAIHPSFTHLPHQAFKAHLPLIPHPSSSPSSPSLPLSLPSSSLSSLSYSPPNSQSWPLKSINFFESLVQEKILLAFILDKTPDGSLEMVLYQTSTDRDDEEKEDGGGGNDHNNLGVGNKENNNEVLNGKHEAKEINDDIKNNKRKKRINNDDINYDSRESATSDICVAMVTTGMAEYSNTYIHELTKKQTSEHTESEVVTVLGGSGDVLCGVLIPG